MDQELIQYLDQRFQTIDLRFQAVDQKLQAHDQRFVSLEELIRTSSEETKWHTGVLVEGLRHELHLVAEGLVMHIEVRHREDREYFDRKFEDLSALFRSSHDHLQQQQDQLRQSQDQLRQRFEDPTH
jgi:prefoldin subunit 5